jgi:AAT family amino acid transporter
MEFEKTSELSRGLKSRHLQMIALGGIIGSGYFLGSSYIIGKAGPASTLAYLLGGLIVFAVMLCMGELAVARPVAGSFISYSREFISPAWACGVGWSYWLTWVTYVPSEMIAAGIIMHAFIPQVSEMWWAVAFGLIITGINLSKVHLFGEMEFWLALFKILALVMFVILGGLIAFGVIGEQGYIGNSILAGSGFAPDGYWVVLLTMVIILVNFQGSEIIGLAAAEAKEPDKSIPRTIKQVTFRIVGLYIIPIAMLVTIFPWDKAGLENSVFAAALDFHGLSWAGGLFSFIVLTAAISCSNSGLYACTRALYALSQEGMAPSWFSELNKHGVPQNATAVSIVCCWIGVMVYTFDQDKNIYTYLLALSGFSGAIAWISICWSQLNFRRRLEQEGDVANLSFKTPWFPYVTHFGIWAQVVCLLLVAFTEELRTSLYIGIPALVAPVIVYYLVARRKTAAQYS